MTTCGRDFCKLVLSYYHVVPRLILVLGYHKTKKTLIINDINYAIITVGEYRNRDRVQRRSSLSTVFEPRAACIIILPS